VESYLTFRLPRFEILNRPLKVAKFVSCIMYQLYTHGKKRFGKTTKNFTNSANLQP